MGPRPHLSLCACKTTRLTSELLVSMGPSLHLSFLYAKLRLYDQNYKSLWVPALICGLWIQNSAFRTRIASLNGSQPSSEVFPGKTGTFGSELQFSMGPRSHLSFCKCKTAWLASELQVSMGLSSHLLFCAFTTATLWPELIVSMGPRSHLSFCACKTAWLAPELLVFMCPRPHLSFCAFKTASSATELQVSKGPSPHMLFFLHSKQHD